jgi:SulP family sulfate permease
MFVGAVLAVDAVGHCVALASFCFAGSLSAGLGLATGTMLLSTAVMTAALFVFSRLRNVLGIAQDTSIALLAPAIAVATAGLSGATDEARVATGLAVMGSSALLSGMVFWIVGQFGLGRMVRLFPYPVSAGFLAGSGALLVMAGLFIVSGTDGWEELLLALEDRHVLFGLVAALVFAAALIVAQHWVKGSNAILGVVGVAIAGFYVVLAVTQTDMSLAQELGYLPKTGSETSQAIGPALSLLAQVDWMAVFQVAPSLAAVALLSLLGVLLNTSGVELATHTPVDVNRELRVTGLANILIAPFAGLTSFLQAGASIFANKLGTSAQPMVLGNLAVIGLAIAFAGKIVAVVPVFVAAGLLIFIGASMLEDWLIKTRRTLMPRDWYLIVVIVALTAVLGILPAVGIGLGLAVLEFAIGYARLPVIRKFSDARAQPSVVDRAPEESAILAREGHRIQILYLQGALFFGSIDKMASDIGKITTADAQIAEIILDFGGVDSVDSAACAGLAKLTQAMAGQGIALHLCHMAPRYVAVLARWGLTTTADRNAPLSDLRLWPRLDDALEQCEERLLDRTLGAGRIYNLQNMLAELGQNDRRITDLLAILEPRVLAMGEVLIAAGSRSDDVYLLESGRLGVHLPGPNSPGTRVRVLAPGALVGEMAQLLGLPRSADVIAQSEVKVWRMPPGLADQDPGLALLWTTILARALALKLSQTNRLVGMHRMQTDTSRH